MQQAPLELRCDACGVRLHATTEDELVELGTRHGLSIHGQTPPPEDLLNLIRTQNW